jgi:hypothetical protein
MTQSSSLTKATTTPLASIFGSGFLILAYVISVSLYLHILASFVLGGFNADTELNENIITTAVIGVIMFIGVTKGLAPLEFPETRIKASRWSQIISTTVYVAFVALASRAFAFYYLLQCFVAFTVSKSSVQKLGLLALSLLLAFITVFAVPAS